MKGFRFFPLIMGKSYAFYQANRSNSYHENKSRTNCKEHDRSDNHASRSRLRADIREDPDLVDSTVRDRKRNSRWEGYREEAYHRVSRPPPKLKAIYNETGHDIHSLTLEEVQNVLCSQALGSSVLPCQKFGIARVRSSEIARHLDEASGTTRSRNSLQNPSQRETPVSVRIKRVFFAFSNFHERRKSKLFVYFATKLVLARVETQKDPQDRKQRLKSNAHVSEFAPAGGNPE